MKERVEGGEGGSSSGPEWMLGTGHPNQGDSSRTERRGWRNRSVLLKGCWVATMWGALWDNVSLRPDYQGWVKSFELIVKVAGSCRFKRTDS